MSCLGSMHRSSGHLFQEEGNYTELRKESRCSAGAFPIRKKSHLLHISGSITKCGSHWMWVIPRGQSFGEAPLISEGYILTALLAAEALHPLLMQDEGCIILSTLGHAHHYDSFGTLCVHIPPTHDTHTNMPPPPSHKANQNLFYNITCSINPVLIYCCPPRSQITSLRGPKVHG